MTKRTVVYPANTSQFLRGDASFETAGGAGAAPAISGSNGSFTFSTATFGNLNGLSFYTSNGSVVGSYTVPAAGAAITVSDAASSGTIGRLAFTNLNGVTLSLSTGAAGSHTIVGSHNALTSQSNQAVSGSNGSFTFQTLSLGNSNGISFGSSGSSITASHNALTSQSNQALSGPNGSFTFQTAQFHNSHGISWSTTTGSGIIASHNGLTTAALSNHSHGNPQLNLTNLSGTTASNSAGFTLSLSAAAPGGGAALTVSDNATSLTVSRLAFTQSNGVTMSLSTGAGVATVIASHNGLTTAALSNHSHGDPQLNLTNLSGTTASNSAGFTLSLSAAAPGGGAGINRSFFEIIDGERLTTNALLNNATYSNRPIFMPFWMDGQGLSVKTAEFLLSRTGGTSLAMTAGVGIYSISNSTRIDLVSSTTNAYSLTTSAQFSGIRRYPITGLSDLTLSEGRWILGAYFSCPATASMGLNAMGGDAVNVVGFVLPGTNSTAATATGSHHLPFWGVLSATSAGFPASVALSAISGGNSARNPDLYVILKQI